MSKKTNNTMLFTENHEWIRVDGDIATLGITQFAQGELGDIVYFDFPDVGASHPAEDSVAVVESVKTVSDIYMPVAGTITEINPTLDEEPDLANTSPENEGWIFKFKIDDKKELKKLLSDEQYRELNQ